MGQWLRVIAVLPEGMSLILATTVACNSNPWDMAPSSGLHKQIHIHVIYSHKHTQINKNNKNKYFKEQQEVIITINTELYGDWI